MTDFRQSGTALAVSALLAATPAAATPSSLWELLTIDRVATWVTQYAIALSRTVAQVTYTDLDIAVLEGRVALTGLSVQPYASPGDGDCAFSADRIVMTAAPLDQLDYGAANIDIIGLEMSPGCLSEIDRMELAQMGLDRFVLDRVQVQIEQVIASAETRVDFQAVSEGLAEVSGSVDLSYFAVDVTGRSPEPVAYLRHAEYEIHDQGAWANLAPMLPPFIADPETLRQMLSAELMRGGGASPTAPAPVTPDPTAPAPISPDPVTPTPAVPSKQGVAGDTGPTEQFIGELATALAGFAAEPGRFALTLSPPEPVLLTEEMFEDFGLFVSALHPSVSTSDAPEITRVTGAEIETLTGEAESGEIALEAADRLRIARAFLTGIGAPRNTDTALQILRPLLEDNHPVAVAMALEALDDLDPGLAYQLAHRAAAEGNRAAFARLDALERALPVADIRAVQTGEAPELSGEESPADLRRRGYDALIGLGTPRNYAHAYFYGLLALAEGDRAAASLVDEIEAMIARAPEEETAEWQGMADAVQARVTAHFFGLAADETAEPETETDQ